MENQKNKDNIQEKKQIKEEVLTRINQKIPKQQILEELSPKYKDKITIIKQLENTPSVAMKKKYFKLNYILAGLLFLALIMDVLSAFRSNWIYWIQYVVYLNMILDVVLCIGTALYRIETYSWIAARGIVSILQIIITNAYFRHPVDMTTLISLGLIIISFFLGLYLGVRLCPPRVPKKIEVTIDENEKIQKTIYVFPD